MDDSPNSGSRLEVSVSFGRFENDALSWEKWSSFSPNKYLEEVGNLSTPGSVAQKKAYFEAHYKRIAAKKAEVMEQEKSTGPVNRSLNASSKEDCYANSTETDNKFSSSNGEKLVEEIALLKTNVAVSCEAKDDNNDRSNVLLDMINLDEGKEDGSSVVKCESLKIDEIKDESAVSIDEPELNVGKDSSEVKDDNNDGSNGFMDVISSDEEKQDASGVVKCKSSKIEEIKNELNVSIDEPELNVGNDSSEVKDDKNDGSNGFVDMIILDEEKEDVSGVKWESSKIGEIKDESNISVDDPELNVGKSFVSVGLETSRKDSKDILEKRRERRNGGEKQKSVLKKENSKSTRNITQKVTRTEKERNPVMTKKKIASPGTKPLQAAATRYSKPTFMSTPISAPRDLKKKANVLQFPRSSNVSVKENKRGAPTSLHMSLSLDPTNSLGGLSMTRKSLIMESMGDKDIVKRAFKTFQNRTNGSMSDEKPSAVKHVPSTALKPKVSSFQTPTKGNTGVRKDTEKTATPRSHPGTKSNPLPSGLHKTSATSRKNTTVFSPATGLKNDEKTERRKEFLKKLEAKSIAREAANAQLSAKSMMGVANEIHQQPTLGR